MSYSSAISTSFDFDRDAGSKTVRIKLKDGAGNESGWYYDSISLQIPTLRFAYKGAYPTSTYIYYYGVTEPSGSYNTRYYFYYFPITEGITNVTLPDPNSGGTVYYHTYSENTSSANLTLPSGELRYYWVRAYNADSGGWGPFTATSTLAFASNVTIIYDDDESDDLYRAKNLIKPILRDDANITGYSTIYGTMPTWTVTLLPEDYISNTYSTENRIYGDPIIATAGTSFSWGSSTNDGRARNIATSGRGLVGMGMGGNSLIDRIDANWVRWGLTGQQPDEIGAYHSMGFSTRADVKTRPYTTSESIWFYPLYYDYLYNNFYNSSTTVAWWNAGSSTEPTKPSPTRGVYLPKGVAPAGGSIYVADPQYSSHFPVVRQGRFLFYGYDKPPYYYYFGYPLFINLIAKMGNY
jgi:hypothetical protein